MPDIGKEGGMRKSFLLSPEISSRLDGRKKYVGFWPGTLKSLEEEEMIADLSLPIKFSTEHPDYLNVALWSRVAIVVRRAGGQRG